MAKRFIDTNLFDDPWFMELPLPAKVLWLYSITKCNHAGIFELNEKLCGFQTGIGKSLATVRQQLGNRWVTLECGKIFIPSFVAFQYPKGIRENVLVQNSVKKELEKYGLWDKELGTVKQEFGNSLPSVKVEVEVKDKVKVKAKVKVKDVVIKGTFILPDWIPADAWNNYLEMRKNMKKPMTSAAQNIAANKLIKLVDYPNNGEATQVAEKILNESILNNWQGLFPLKEEKDGKKNSGSDSKFTGLNTKNYEEGAF